MATLTELPAEPQTAGEEELLRPKEEGVVALEPEDGAQTCAICLDHPGLGDTAYVKNCQHSYCVLCILKWAACRERPSCPQCKSPFDYLWCHRKLDGGLSDCLLEEAVVLLKRAPWFLEHLRELDKGPRLGADGPLSSPASGQDQPWGAAVAGLDQAPAGGAGVSAWANGEYDYDYEEEEEDYDDDALEDYYLRGRGRSTRVIIGNRRWGENGSVRAGRMYARPVQPPDPVGASSSSGGRAAAAGASGSKASTPGSVGKRAAGKQPGGGGHDGASGGSGSGAGGSGSGAGGSGRGAAAAGLSGGGGAARGGVSRELGSAAGGSLPASRAAGSGQAATTLAAPGLTAPRAAVVDTWEEVASDDAAGPSATAAVLPATGATRVVLGALGAMASSLRAGQAATTPAVEPAMAAGSLQDALRGAHEGAAGSCVGPAAASVDGTTMQVASGAVIPVSDESGASAAGMPSAGDGVEETAADGQRASVGAAGNKQQHHKGGKKGSKKDREKKKQLQQGAIAASAGGGGGGGEAGSSRAHTEQQQRDGGGSEGMASTPARGAVTVPAGGASSTPAAAPAHQAGRRAKRSQRRAYCDALDWE